jgi:hypothetical protein
MAVSPGNLIHESQTTITPRRELISAVVMLIESAFEQRLTYTLAVVLTFSTHAET